MSNLPKADTVRTRKSYHPTEFNVLVKMALVRLFLYTKEASFLFRPLKSSTPPILGYFPWISAMWRGLNSPKFVLHYFEITHTHNGTLSQYHNHGMYPATLHYRHSVWISCDVILAFNINFPYSGCTERDFCRGYISLRQIPATWPLLEFCWLRDTWTVGWGCTSLILDSQEWLLKDVMITE